MDNSSALWQLFERFGTFFRSADFRTIGLFTVGYLALLWLAIIIWVTRDAIHRSTNLFFQIGAVLLNIFLPLLGLILYLILRPEQTLIEKYHENLFEARRDFCPNCHMPCHHTFDFCPNCAEKLNQSCHFCQRSFVSNWKICPHCGKTAEEKTAFTPQKVTAKTAVKKTEKPA